MTRDRQALQFLQLAARQRQMPVQLRKGIRRHSQVGYRSRRLDNLPVGRQVVAGVALNRLDLAQRLGNALFRFLLFLLGCALAPLIHRRGRPAALLEFPLGHLAIGVDMSDHPGPGRAQLLLGRGPLRLVPGGDALARRLQLGFHCFLVGRKTNDDVLIG